jgi:hypothetical protein
MRYDSIAHLSTRLHCLLLLLCDMILMHKELVDNKGCCCSRDLVVVVIVQRNVIILCTCTQYCTLLFVIAFT